MRRQQQRHVCEPPPFPPEAHAERARWYSEDADWHEAEARRYAAKARKDFRIAKIAATVAAACAVARLVLVLTGHG